MKIAVEATQILKPKPTGVGQYALNLVRQLALSRPGDDILLTSFIDSHKTTPDLSLANISLHRIPLPRWLYSGFDHHLWAPPVDFLAGIRPDVFIFPAFWAWPTLPGTRTVVVIHDLAFLEVPETVPAAYRTRLSRQVPQSLARADAVIAVSDATKSQIVKRYDTPPAKISVARPGIDAHVFYPREAKEIEALKSKYNLPKRYLLFLGSLEPRKNVLMLLKAYEAYAGAQSDPVPLVLAGADGWLNEEISAELARLKKTLPVTRLGYLPDLERPVILSGAEAFVFPSLYEGFGMPVVEAMACGTPVITADNSSLPEAAGEAALLINTIDSSALSSSISELLDDPKLAAQLRQKGIVQAKKFTWEQTGQVVEAAIQRLAQA